MGKEITVITPEGKKHMLLTSDKTPEPVAGDYVEIDGQTLLVDKRVFTWANGQMTAYLKYSDE